MKPRNITAIGGVLTSALTVIAALPYELGEAATIIAPQWKATIAVAGVIATAILRIVHSMQKP